MPQIEANDKSLSSLEGLHLWHAPLSSCSQRVRLVMAELGLAYTSHLINLEAGEHASASYQAIHPKGLVPALVDNGNLHIESIDIIRYLAQEQPALTQAPDDLLYLADGAQLDLKLLTFEFLFRGAPPAPEEQSLAFHANHQNQWLKNFYLDFVAGFELDRVEHAVRRTAAGFEVLEARLADGREYLGGDVFSLADIAWLPNLHRFTLMQWPMQKYPNLAAWLERMRTRPSYQTALMDWQPPEVVEKFTSYTQQRQSEGTDISAFGGLRQ